VATRRGPKRRTPGHENSRVVRIDDEAYQMLGTIAAAQRRSRRAQFTVIIEEYYNRVQSAAG